MNLTDLQTFQRVAELGSLSAAARQMDAPVSQISRAISRLEAQHRVRLLHRSTHALSLTEAGQSLMAHGRRMLESWQQFEAEVSTAGEIGGTIEVTLSPVMAQYVVVPCLLLLSQTYPKLQVQLHVDDRFVDMAKQGIDVAIRTGEPGSEALVARQIGEMGRRLYAAPAYIAAYGAPQSIEDLGQHRLITSSVLPLFNRWPFRVAGQSVVHQARGIYRVNSTGIMMGMGLQGLGIIRGSTVICEPLAAQGKLVRVLDQWVDCVTIPINAVMLQERHRAPKVRAFVDFLAQWLAQHTTPHQAQSRNQNAPKKRKRSAK